MRALKTMKRFERDLKKVTKRGKRLDKLWGVVEKILANQPPPPATGPTA